MPVEGKVIFLLLVILMRKAPFSWLSRIRKIQIIESRDVQLKLIKETHDGFVQRNLQGGGKKREREIGASLVVLYLGGEGGFFCSSLVPIPGLSPSP